MHTLRLPLKTNKNTEGLFEKRFQLIARIHNQTVKHAKKLLTQLDKSKEYRTLRKEYGELKVKADAGDELAAIQKALVADKMNAFRDSLGLSKNAFDKYVAKMQHKYKKHINSHQAQVEAERVWAGVEKVLFGDGKDVHYKKITEFKTIRGKNHTTGIFFCKDTSDTKCPYFVKWGSIVIPVKMPDTVKADLPDGGNYVLESLKHEIKYCELERLWFKSGWRYYANVYFDGDAPKKLQPGRGTMGIDEGPSTVAAVSEDLAILEELAPKCKDYNKQIARLQRQIDASTRKTNPEKFNKDGTVKKKSEYKGKRWTFSKTCLRKKAIVRELYRRKSEYSTHMHGNIVNRMVKNASMFITEPMDFKALAKRAKETRRQNKATIIKKADGTEQAVYKYKRKKRFGKSVTDRSPAELMIILQRKCNQYELFYYEVDKWEYRASQYDHTTNTYIKTQLSQRFKTVGGNNVQRDLYSAFLLACRWHSKKPSRKKCRELFPHFVKMQNLLIKQMKENGISRPACFGF